MISLRSIFPEIGGPRKMVHFIGIGGIGMSALARLFLTSKIPVSGSDLVESLVTRKLVKEGAKIKIGHAKQNVDRRVGLVIHSLAATAYNPELCEARQLGIPTLSYPEAIGRLTRNYKTIAVSGAHGKSTTTALIALILQKAGLDPTVIVGTNLREFGGKNFRAGRSDWLVLEADEFGRSFLHHSPALAVITNIDLEHLDTYKNLAEIKSAFLQFLKNARGGGAFILNKDNKILVSLARRIEKIAKAKNCKIIWCSAGGNTAQKIRKIIKIPGEHNVANAVAAYKVGRILNIPHKKIISAIGSYRGSWRRMEYRGDLKIENCKLKIFDDYAHHPTEIRATLKAFREKYSHPHIICVYQPHQALRLKKLWRGFIDAFGDADILVLIPMYQVAGRDKVDPRFTSKALASAMRRANARRPAQNEHRTAEKVYYLANPKKIKAFLKKIVKDNLALCRSASGPRQSALVVMMGAGDIVNYTDLLLKK